MSDNEIQDSGPVTLDDLGFVRRSRRVWKRNHDFTSRSVVEERIDRTSHPFDDSLTDPSFAHPASALSQALGASAAMGAAAAQFYDFPDGKDTGQELPASRRIGADLAEISQEQLRIQQDAKAKQDASDKLSSDTANQLKALQDAVAASQEGGSGETV